MTSKPEPLKEKWNHPRSIQNSREEFQGWFWEEDVRSALQNFIRWLHNYSHLTPREWR